VKFIKDDGKDYEALAKALGREPTAREWGTEKGRLLREYERVTTERLMGRGPLYRVWLDTLRPLKEREPRTPLEYAAAGAALVAEPTAAYRLKTVPKRFRERTGICRARKCGRIFFFPMARDGTRAPTGERPVACSDACKRRIDHSRKAAKARGATSNRAVRLRLRGLR
jgi:hypothetical protein